MHYFVNGGGGAYLSLGAVLQWPGDPPTAEWAFYPEPRCGCPEDRMANPVVEATGLVVDGPLSGVAVLGRVSLGAVRLQRGAVLPELRRGPRRGLARRVRLLPYGVHGRLRWRDLSRSAVLGRMTGGTTTSPNGSFRCAEPST